MAIALCLCVSGQGSPRHVFSKRFRLVSHFCFNVYLGDFGVSFDFQMPPEVVCEDKSLYKAKGRVWHEKHRQSGHIPEGLRALDTDASGSTSQYSGGYGYGLHLTTTDRGLPRLAAVYNASVREKVGLDEKIEALRTRHIRCIVADAGPYRLQPGSYARRKGVVALDPHPRCQRPEEGRLSASYRYLTGVACVSKSASDGD